MPVASTESGTPRQDLARKLIDSGVYGELQQLLHTELLKEDWHAKVEGLVAEQFVRAARKATTLNLTRLRVSIEREATQMISPSTQNMIHSASRAHLERLMKQ